MEIEEIKQIIAKMKDEAEDMFLHGDLTPREKVMHDSTLDELSDRLVKAIKNGGDKQLP